MNHVTKDFPRFSRAFALTAIMLSASSAFAQPRPPRPPGPPRPPIVVPTPPQGCVQGTAEICGNNWDDNCNGAVDEGCPAAPPQGCVQGSAEICGNNFDDNCNGVVDEGCAVVVQPPHPPQFSQAEQFCLQRARSVVPQGPSFPPTQPGFPNPPHMGGMARELCRGTQNANAPVDCYLSLIPQNAPQNLPKERGGRPAGWTPQDAVQLCGGTSVRYEPIACYTAAMFGDVPYDRAQVVGGSQVPWNSANALNLCKGANNASQRLSCFTNGIAQGQAWGTMIPQCAQF